MYAFDTKLKILKFWPKQLFYWLLVKFYQKPVMKQKNTKFEGEQMEDFTDGKDQ